MQSYWNNSSRADHKMLAAFHCDEGSGLYSNLNAQVSWEKLHLTICHVEMFYKYVKIKVQENLLQDGLK